MGTAFGLAALKAGVAFIAAVLLGRFLIGPLFNAVSKFRNEEVFTATALLIVLVTAGATGAVGLSLTLGAFLGGMIISETPYRHVIRTEVKPFRGLLLGFFFITVGMALDTEVLLREWPQVLLLLLVTVVITIVRYDVSRGLTPIVRERYPRLTRFVAVESDEERARFEALGMRAVVNRSIPKGVDLAAAVLSAHGVSDDRIHEWMRRQQEQALETAGTQMVSADAA